MRTTRTLRMMACALTILVAAPLVVACESDDGAADDATPAELKVPTTYTFEPTLGTGDAVSYSGQIHRHVLIGDLKSWIGGLTAKIDGGKAYKAGDVRKGLDFFYAYDAGAGADVALTLKTTPATKQAKYGDLSSKSLKAKFAGNDAKGQHKKWATEFAGWKGQASAEGLLLSWFDQLDQLAVDRVAGKIGKDPAGGALTKVYVTETGLDLQQLTQKLLLGAIAFSQGADDYLDDDTANKGLNSDNTKAESDGKAYTALEHAWDEGFGYFGAARDYGDYTDDEIAGKGGRDGYKDGYHDTDGDGKIDLLSELNFGHSLNAAKRDRGSKDLAATDYTKSIFEAFLKGRTIIASAGAKALSDKQMTDLKAQRDIIVRDWEAAMAATLVHYFNETLADMANIGTKDYSFYDHAKHWSELKGFALALQFSRFSPLAKDFAAMHDKIGDAPVLPSADGQTRESYVKALVAARTMVMTAYGFDAKLAGDDKGQGGW